MDYKLIESKMKLRKLELEAYSSLVSAFRAQGNFSKEKKKILNELRSFLSISIERHQAEIRRAINDDKLAKISLSLNGEDPLDTWVIEGRRIIPLLKRMAPKTGVSSVADKVARYQVRQNELEQANKIEEDNESNTNRLATRKRLNSNESINSLKRKCSPIKLKQPTKNLNIQENSQNKTNCTSPILSTITIPTSSLNFIQSSISNSVQGSTIKSDNEKHNQPAKLLIMSTSSMTMNKPIVNTTDCHQFLNVNRIDLEESKSLSSLTELPVSQFITTSPANAAKIYNPKLVQNSSASSSTPKLMILPNNSLSNSSQTKTLTIPISHKALQIPASNSTILYSTQQPIVSSTSNTIKTIPGITIQAIKTTQGQKSNNFIIMPNKANTNIAANTAAGAKGLLRQMNAKEFPLKFIATNEQLIKKDQSIEKTNTDPTQLNEAANERQIPPTIILTTTNVSKEKATNLTNSTNLIKSNQGSHANIIKSFKVIPKSTTTSNLLNSQNNKVNNSTNPITIPAGTNATTFMEILKNIPINRISPLSTDGAKTTINITQNPTSGSPAITKTIKIPANATTESITKLIFTNVMSNSNSNLINLVQDTQNNTSSNLNKNNFKASTNVATSVASSVNSNSTLNAQSTKELIEIKEKIIKDENNECTQEDKTKKSFNLSNEEKVVESTT